MQMLDQKGPPGEKGAITKGATDLQGSPLAKKATLDESQGESDPAQEPDGDGSPDMDDDYEEDEFEQEYRERRRAYDKLEDIKQLKESIR